MNIPHYRTKAAKADGRIFVIRNNTLSKVFAAFRCPYYNGVLVSLSMPTLMHKGYIFLYIGELPFSMLDVPETAFLAFYAEHILI